MPLRSAILHYLVAALLVVGAALMLPQLGAEIARQTGLGEAFVGNILGSNLFNLLILGLDDVFYVRGPLLVAASPSHSVAVVAIVAMNGLFLTGLTYRVLTKRFVVAWDTGGIAAFYAVAVALAYLLRQP